MREVYLDNSATTKVCDTALSEATEMMKENYGNPSSGHLKGIQAENTLDLCRKTVAKLINCDSNEIYFTSGGTQSNNIAILGSAAARRHLGNKIITTYIEHSSVLRAMEKLEKQGFKVVYLRPDKYGAISLSKLANEIDKSTILVSLMLVNNEIGSFIDISKVKRIIKIKNSPAILHTDAVQAFGKIPINVKAQGIDMLSMSAHKIHGLKGVGALYIAKGLRIDPILFGGGQESGLIPGTEPMPAIAGFKGAVTELIKNKGSQTNISELNKYCRRLLAKNSAVRINSPQNAIPNILNISVKRIKSETMMNFLSSHGIYVSNGSACSKGKRSHVLTAIGLPDELIDSSIRISFSRFNTKEDVDYFIKYLNEGINKLIKF